ncbi:MAG: DEAD/DEAH box helicase, partial [Acidobacteria bacterium]|nr:DEAD/DEAH box helicase [Acidobacteriota bacterium]
MFQVLVHASLYASLRRLPGERRDRFRRLVDRLRAGRWDGGARVKKLQGVGKPVFEARPDDRDRILFTLSRSASPDRADWLETYLQIWDLVHHDRVEGRAARLNLSAEAEFLDYREVESESITEPPPHPTASFGEVPPATPGGRAGVVDLMLPPDDWRPAEREEVAGCVRWYLVPDRWLTRDEDWQALMDGGAEELELKLTAEQYAVVRAPGPVLLSGSAGSGKTTIAVHRLAAAASGPDAGRTLYLTYSPWLLDYARRLFRDLLLCRGGPTRGGVEFLTVDDLYRALVACRGGKAPAGTAGFGEFSSWHRRAVGEGDAALAWEEIRSIVKGACLDPGRAMLHRGEYEALGRKRAPLFESRREGLYRVARRWQKHLEETGRLDEIDLCRMALAQVGPGDAYDHIVCDEAQDLAEIQVDLLLRLQRGRNLQGLFLAGDPQQVINPSGFRWAEVRTAIRRRFLDSGRPTPALHALTRNFRSVRGLVDLANEVLALKRERTGRSDGDEAEESMVAGAAPIRVVGKEADLIRAAAGFGPRCAVVAGSGAVRDRLVRELDTTRIFLVPEVKGLEFDVVILWGFLAANPDPWRRLLDPALDLREDPQCRRALHHLYVAVTRARRHLAVYEPDDAPWFWTSARFRGKIDPESPDLLGRLFARSADPADWLREGEYFLVRGRHRQAAECFRRGNDPSREAECLALHHESAGEPGEAAGMWLSLGRWNRTAQCLETAGRFQEAARLWSQAGD